MLINPTLETFGHPPPSRLEQHHAWAKNFMKIWFVVLLALPLTLSATETNYLALSNQIHSVEETIAHLDAKLSRQLNELSWFQRLSDVALVDKVNFTGPPPKGTNNLPSPPGSNDVIVSAMTFLPRQSAKKVPLIVFAHSEIHGNVATHEEARVVREMVQQGYAVIAPDYRGSSGYGADYWHQIDYGGLEIEDVHAARNWMLSHHPNIDPKRVGMAGWSHGGLIALLTVFRHPNDYQVCYAGVPVSDLEERIKVRGEDYEKLFSAPYHIGKTVAEAPEEYHRRSPARNVAKLQTPLLVHTTTNDEDVKFTEVLKLIDALKHEGKDFQYHIYTNAPGGHLFNRLDTSVGEESRHEIWLFLAKYLKPAHTLPPER
jgi:dienelactone hydrolase